MKFEDIQKYTKPGHWECFYTLDFAVKTIEEWVIEDNLLLNPDFQRGNVWTEKQQVAYIEFLLKGGKSARVIYFNHPGWMGSFNGQMVCVDGLQRITAIQKFINNEIKVFNTYYKDFEDHLPLDNGIDNKIKEYVLYNRYVEAGASGGNYLGDNAEEFINFEKHTTISEVIDLVLEKTCPGITYLQAKKIDKLIIRNNKTEYEYYGNYSDYVIEYIILSELEYFLETGNIVRK